MFWLEVGFPTVTTLDSSTGTEIRPHPHPSLQNIFPITAGRNVSLHLTDVYHSQLLKIERDALINTAMGIGFERCCWQTSFITEGKNSSITVKYLFISTFLLQPVVSPTTFVSIPVGFLWNESFELIASRAALLIALWVIRQVAKHASVELELIM